MATRVLLLSLVVSICTLGSGHHESPFALSIDAENEMSIVPGEIDLRRSINNDIGRRFLMSRLNRLRQGHRTPKPKGILGKLKGTDENEAKMRQSVSGNKFNVKNAPDMRQTNVKHIERVIGRKRRSAAPDDGPSFNQEANNNIKNVNNTPSMNQSNLKTNIQDVPGAAASPKPLVQKPLAQKPSIVRARGKKKLKKDKKKVAALVKSTSEPVVNKDKQSSEGKSKLKNKSKRKLKKIVEKFGRRRRAAADDGPSFNQESSDNKYNVNNDPDMNQENIKEVILNHGPIYPDPRVNEEKEAKNNAGISSSTVSPLSSTVASPSTTTASPPGITVIPSSTTSASPVSEKDQSRSTASSSIPSTLVTPSSTVKPSSVTPASSPNTSPSNVKTPSTLPYSTSSKGVELSSASSVSSPSISASTSPASISSPVSSSTDKSVSVPMSSHASTIAVSPSTTTPSLSSQTVKSLSNSSWPIPSYDVPYPTTPAAPSSKEPQSPLENDVPQKPAQPKEPQNINLKDLQAYIESMVGRRKRSPKGASFNQQANSNKNNTNNSPKMNQENVKTLINSQLLEKKPAKPSGKGKELKSKVKKQPKKKQVKSKTTPKSIIKRSAAVDLNQEVNNNEHNVNNIPRMRQENSYTNVVRQIPAIGVSPNDKDPVRNDSRFRRFAKGPTFNQKSNKNEYNVNNRPRMNQLNVKSKIHDHHPIVPGPLRAPVSVPVKPNNVLRKRSPANGAKFNQKANRNEYNVNNRPKMNQANVDTRRFIIPPPNSSWQRIGRDGGY